MGRQKINDETSHEERTLLTIGEVIAETAAAVAKGNPDQINITKIRARLAAKYGLKSSPKLVDIIAAVPHHLKKDLLPMYNTYYLLNLISSNFVNMKLYSRLKAKPIRTASGIAVVAVMCKPHRCPHVSLTGNVCVYCPGGPDSDFEYSTQSYTGYEPTSMRAIRARYNPLLQTRHRVEQLRQLGHSVDKVEFIVMGGTFMCLSEDYRDYFIR